MLSPRHSSIRRPRHESRLRLWRRPTIAAVAVVAVVGLVTSASPGMVAVADTDIALSPGDRVLQSVQVEMASDGTLTAVGSETVAADAAGTPSDTATQAYSPADVVDDLPVRVVTSYRTDDGVGSDLSDLQGYTGKVQIDLTVQNLTVTPEDISYDVDGTSRSQPALVGVPLTVVASAALPDVPGSSVVTSEDAQDESTNGVLSQTPDGVTQVQWATILAPPQLGSSARLSLVVDAKDFAPPSFDLSVQPGLVTDTSVGALVESVFDPAASDEQDLQARTIEVIGDVNEVLGRAGDSINTVRTTLDASADTLGTKTAEDLKSSVTEITSSMRTLDGTITGLGDDLSSTLESTGSSSVEQLQKSVKAVDKLLGDTSAQARTAPVKGSGCDVDVSTTGGARTVFGSLLRVGGRLQAFSDATSQCKRQLQDSIVDSIGPAEPNDENCLNQNSVTCSIYGTASTFAGITQRFIDSANTAKESLNRDQADQATYEAGEVLKRATALRAAVNLLSGNFDVVYLSLDTLKDERGELAGVIDGLHDDVAGLTATTSALGMAQTQNFQLAARVCDGANPVAGDIDPETANEILGYLVNSYPVGCTVQFDLANQTERTLTPPAGGKSMETLLDENATEVARIAADLDPANTTGSVGVALGELDAAIVDIENALGQAESAKTKDAEDLKTLQQLADDTFGQAQKVVVQTGVVLGGYDAAIKGLDDAVAAAQQEADQDVTAQIQEGIRQVTDQAQQDRADVGKAFDQSAAGLDDAARDIVNDGRATVKGQRKDLTGSQNQAAKGIDKLVDQGLVQIAKGVQTSTRDNKAVTTLLTDDLNKVLADIGQPGGGGSGLLGSLATNAATAGTADYQLALATRTTTSYANVRGQDIAGILLRQEQTERSVQQLADLPAFGIDVPQGVEHRTVYVFHVTGTPSGSASGT